ncbi:MAG: Lrp/AsnC family transcriptional regulator [bacterium]|nr:Lrp/AsnC family transcriptional regulator [bacterium]
MKNLLELEPIQKFLKTVGPAIAKYFGESPVALVYLKPNGAFYAHALHEWLLKEKKVKDITISGMEDDGAGMEEGKIRGRKVLLMDGEIVTGAAYKRSMDALKTQKVRLNIKDIKFAAYIDRADLSDFSAQRYTPDTIWRLKNLDAKDLKMILLLGENGRASLASLAAAVGLSQVAVKTRLENLLQNKILSVRGLLNTERFYAMSAGIQITADSKAIEKLVESFEQKQEVYHMRKMSGRYNLVVGILARTVEDVEEFVEKEVRSVPGVKELDVYIGELPTVPKFVPAKLTA